MAIGQVASTGKQSGGSSGGSTIYEIKFEATVSDGKLWIKFISSQKLETPTEVANYLKSYTEIDVNGCFVPSAETPYSAVYMNLIPYVLKPRPYDWYVECLKMKISSETLDKGGAFYGYSNIDNIVCREV